MFTINIYVRFALIALCLVGGIILAFAYGFWYAFPFLLAGVILLAGYILLGTVQSAGQMMQDLNTIEDESQRLALASEVENRLALTIKPDWLFTTNRAYYNMIKGTLASLQKDSDAAATYLSKAQDIGLSSDNEKAMIELQMANIAVTKNNWNKAQIHLKKLKGLNVTEPMIKEQIQLFEKGMKNRGAVKAARRQGMNPQMRPGGKRRRPKMR